MLKVAPTRSKRVHRRVTAPEGDYGLDLVAFLHVRGPFDSESLWHRYLKRAWSGDLVGEVTICFTVGERAGEVVGVVNSRIAA